MEACSVGQCYIHGLIPDVTYAGSVTYTGDVTYRGDVTYTGDVTYAGDVTYGDDVTYAGDVTYQSFLLLLVLEDTGLFSFNRDL